MSRSNAAAIVAALSLAACSPAHSAHVAVSGCTVEAARGIATLRARVRNDAEKPIGQIDVRADAYRDFRFVRATFSPSFSPVLDPGASRDVVDRAPLKGAFGATAAQCTVAAVTYGDGTTDAASP